MIFAASYETMETERSIRKVGYYVYRYTEVFPSYIGDLQGNINILSEDVQPPNTQSPTWKVVKLLTLKQQHLLPILTEMGGY